LGGYVEQPLLMSKYDVIHKPEVHNIITATPPEVDRATVTWKQIC